MCVMNGSKLPPLSNCRRLIEQVGHLFAAMNEKRYTGEDYDKVFDIDFYLSEISEDNEVNKSMHFHNSWLVEIGKQGKIGGQRLLEIGTGPSLQNAAALVDYFERIVLSDFADRNRSWLKDWWQGNSPSPSKKLIQQIIDLDGSGKSVEEKEEEIRNKVEAIVPSNIKKENPLSPCVFDPFDAVIIRYVFDASVRGEQEYSSAINNIARLIRPGGLLTVLEITSEEYTLNVTFRGCGLDENAVRNIWEKSGLKLLAFEVQYTYFKNNKWPVFNILAQKGQL